MYATVSNVAFVNTCATPRWHTFVLHFIDNSPHNLDWCRCGRGRRRSKVFRAPSPHEPLSYDSNFRLSYFPIRIKFPSRPNSLLPVGQLVHHCNLFRLYEPRHIFSIAWYHSPLGTNQLTPATVTGVVFASLTGPLSNQNSDPSCLWLPGRSLRCRRQRCTRAKVHRC